jgi:hypothetical protein
MTIGLEFTTSIFTEPLAFRWLTMAGVTAESEIFWMMADFAMPVPAAGAPAFWTKNISSVAGYLVNESISRLLCYREVDYCGIVTYHTGASWNMGSDSVWLSNVKVGLGPMMSRNSSS